ncbi:hypothetical protein ETB97_006415 [Aspergillus alliaceus]|uniref:Uncharacterized protein n=1 Tax=Petromyces alliaceus TaxID=209559 RepID=A0A8H6E2J9_PETAA|nr:hypothetical protein ETB97_006415 [Aspergillus burnettii]
MKRYLEWGLNLRHSTHRRCSVLGLIMSIWNTTMSEYLLDNKRIKKEDMFTIAWLAEDIETLGSAVVLKAGDYNVSRFVDMTGTDLVASLNKSSMFQAFRRLSTRSLKRLIDGGLPATIKEENSENTNVYTYNKANVKGKTALGKAIALRAIDSVRTLLNEEGVSPPLSGTYLSPSYIATSSLHVEMVQLLLKRGADPNRVESTVKYTRKLNTVDHLFESNERLAHDIVKHGMGFYNIPQRELDEFIKQNEKPGINTDRTSVSQAMKHFVRDWADEGHDERQKAFPCVLGTLANMSRTVEQPLRVLLPGGGLGRLAHEVDGLGGFEVTMNEWSMYMNLAYRYLAGRSDTNSNSFHPYIDWWSHHATTADLQRSVSFPNRLASRSVVLVEGDFTTVFAEDTGKYDVIVTLFFIDTARNLVSYLENIHRLLRPGGQWVNLGPLLYGSAPFLQLSLDEILALSEDIGFVFQETDASCGDITIPGMAARGKEVAYAQNEKGLSKNAYQAQFWVAKKS